MTAVRGCDYVLHVASPFPIVSTEETIKTAIDGTLNVLKACQNEASVKKVVLTSSCAAVNEGNDPDRIFDEGSWTNTRSSQVDFYAKSKTLAEKAAWDFVANIQDGNKFKLTTLNPTLIVGPPLIDDDQGTSITLIRRFLNPWEMPGVPGVSLALVDVRDVAKAHIEAMRRPETDGERILCTSQPSFWFRDFARILGKEFRRQGYWVPLIQVPYAVVYIFSFFDAQAASVLHRIGPEVKFSNKKAKRLLGLEFRDPAESIVEMTYHLIERGIIKKKSGYTGMPDKYKMAL
ncbi:unnamed protein product, partial [Mesorhabditis belari]|uniref:3-beta hydroxysteroid dehydrogenase/isomerase domain-containing protein n=1 Tax=Mesorhabditis belari TaxID=2138241 RepID=A0AAF3F0U9_9BILA